jgi:minor extracellular serine protease Vpr
MMDSLARMAARMGVQGSPARLHVVAGAALSAAVLVMSSTAIAEESALARFKPLDHTHPLKLQQMPLAARSNEKVLVVVTMSAQSVAEVRAGTADHRINAVQHGAIHSQVMQQHATIEPSINARGGRVLAHYKDALNGMKVEIARGEIAGLASLPGVVQVVPVVQHTRDNVVSVPFIGAPLVWQRIPGFKGEHIKVAVIDTGIDYTHANFGGPGTPEAWTTAQANSTLPADPSMFGPTAPKVKGGIDLAGDAYDARDPTSVPVPDPNPLDCAAHGSHVAGTIAGFGVTNDGKTYTGPYNAAAYSAGFQIGPGVAPLADIYAVRIFGCAGSTNLTVDGIEWAVDNDMDVINMSLGSQWGTSFTADAIASDNASKAGIVVVAAAGNSGPIPYVTGTPASGTRVISVAATDAHQFIPNGVQVTLSSGATAQGQDFNPSLALPGGTVPALILNSGGTLGFGCNASDYPTSGAAGAVVIASRGTCSFDQKGVNAAAAGAAAIVLVNNSPASVNPIIDQVTIPFIIVPLSYNGTFAAAPSAETGTVAAANVPNAGFRLAANFTSMGPRSGDGALKPNITAPGVNVISTGMGTGNQGFTFSGTSMASPHVAGVAALAVQAHATWTERAVREAVAQTGNPAAFNDYAPRNEGAGLVQAVGATATQVTAHGTEDFDLGLLSFGVAEMTKDFHESREVVLRNHGHWPAGFSLEATSSAGSVPSSAVLSRSFVYVNGHDDAQFRMSLDIPAATVGGTHDASGNLLFQDASGYVTLSPRLASSNNGVSLTLPYYAVPVARSAVTADLRGGRNPVVRLANRRGLISGNGDFYAWGLYNPTPGTAQEVFVPRAIGVQSNPISETDSILVFAVNTYGRLSNPDSLEYDILIDVNGDGVADFDLFSADLGSVTTGTLNGVMVSVLMNLTTGAGFIEANVDAPFNGSIVEIPVFAADMGLSPTSPRFTYTAAAFNLAGGTPVSVPGTGAFNAFAPAVANAIFVPVAPGATLDVPVFVDPTEIKLTPALGFMVVTEDNVSGATEATLIKLK